MSALLGLAGALGVLAAPPLQVTVSVGGALAQSTAYEHRYVPRVDFDTTSGGLATQSLRLDPAKGPLVLEASLGLPLGARHVVEASVLTTAWPLDGTSGPHAYRLDYTTRQPPSGDPVSLALERATPWPDPEGRMRHVSFGVVLKRRVALGTGTGLSLLAGPFLQRVSGRFESLAFLTARPGGHGVLFADEHALEVALDPRWKPGVVAGAEIDARLRKRVALVLGARYHHVARVDLQPRVTAVVNADQLFSGLSAEDIARRLTPEPVRFQASFLQAEIGLRFTP